MWAEGTQQEVNNEGCETFLGNGTLFSYANVNLIIVSSKLLYNIISLNES